MIMDQLMDPYGILNDSSSDEEEEYITMVNQYYHNNGVNKSNASTIDQKIDSNSTSTTTHPNKSNSSSNNNIKKHTFSSPFTIPFPLYPYQLPASRTKSTPNSEQNQDQPQDQENQINYPHRYPSPVSGLSGSENINAAALPNKNLTYSSDDSSDDPLIKAPQPRRLSSLSRFRTHPYHPLHVRSSSHPPAYTLSSNPPPFHQPRRNIVITPSSCEGCGWFGVQRWKKGPHGQRTLCDPCGLKWCFEGVLPSSSHANSLASNSSSTSDQSKQQQQDSKYATTHVKVESLDNSNLSPLQNTVATTTPQPTPTPTPTHKNSSQDYNNKSSTLSGPIPEKLRMMRSQLEAEEREQQRLQMLLNEARKEDAGADRAFRRAIVRCRSVKHLDSVGSNSGLVRKKVAGTEDFDEEYEDDDEYFEVDDETYGISEDDMDHESVLGFINAVRGRQLQM